MQRITHLTFEKTNFKETYKVTAVTDLNYTISPEYYLRLGAEKHFIEKFNRDLMPRCERITENFFEQSLKLIK